MGDDNTKYGGYVRRAKNHPIIAVLLFISTVVILLGAVLAVVIPGINAIRSCGSREPADSPAKTEPAEDTSRDSTSEPPEQEFALIGFSDDSLVAAIERETGYEHSRSSQNNRIEITYSGSLTKIDETDMFYYEGGNLKIVVDEHECAILSGIRIDPSLKAGTPYNALHTWLTDKALSFASRNPTLIAKTVKECLQ